MPGTYEYHKLTHTSAQALWDDTVKLYLVAKCCIIYDVQLQYRTYQQIYVCIRHPKGCTTGKQDLYLYSTPKYLYSTPKYLYSTRKFELIKHLQVDDINLI